MSHLTQADYESALAAIERIHACREIARLPRVVIEAVADLVPTDRVSFEHIAPSIPEMWGISTPEPIYSEKVWQTFLAHIHEHPAITHYQATGDESTHRVYDFVNERQWHRTPLYQELHRGLECEDQMGCCLGPPTRESDAIVLYRRRRGFSERDREALDLVRPHAALACELARARPRHAQKEPAAAQYLLLEEALVPDHRAALPALGLTPREIDVLQEVEQGKTNREIAGALLISPLTVKKHLENIFEKLGVENRTAALARVLEVRPRHRSTRRRDGGYIWAET